ncbi:MAG: exodeoxyribonuclease III [Raineya sp.]|nr:exodeoxyribonuclease III [Raineya sp.]MDW8296217.1 exodeoxyribonuclease III [Raineya sp.]
MKIISYNVNGIRAALRKGFAEWLKATNADMICLQEIKIDAQQFPYPIFENLGYGCYVFPAQKAGYSGVAILSKKEPLAVEKGCGIALYDQEGRILQAHFEGFTLMSVYFPSGSSGEERQAIKMQFLADFYEWIKPRTSENLIICGDFNICHQAIDIHNPQANANSTGFLPEERAWLTDFLNLGFVDTFRYLNPEPHHYTWWSMRSNARAKNLGWRIDYQMISKPLLPKLRKAFILSQACHSDHCPTMIEMEL